MIKPRHSIVFFFIMFLILFIYEWIRSLPKMAADIESSSAAITIASGEAIFWGRGRCHLCHRIGERGYAQRGPNLGESQDGNIIGARADDRARQLQLASGAEYLVQSLIEPGAFVVPNFKNEMPKIHEPPIALSPAELKAVVLYLQSLGGFPDIGAVPLPPELFSNKPTSDFATKISGDAEAGRALFFDAASGAGCASCHVGINANVEPEGGTLGPDLTAVAAYRTPEHIYQKIIKPDSNVVSGYEETLIKTKDDRFFIGVITGETTAEILLIDKNSNKISMRKDQIAATILQRASTMPGNYLDLLTENDLQDLSAYLLTLDGQVANFQKTKIDSAR